VPDGVFRRAYDQQYLGIGDGFPSSLAAVYPGDTILKKRNTASGCLPGGMKATARSAKRRLQMNIEDYEVTLTIGLCHREIRHEFIEDARRATESKEPHRKEGDLAWNGER